MTRPQAGFFIDPSDYYTSMRIHCDNWLEGLRYFLNPDTIEQMANLGLFVERMDAKEKAVYLKAAEDVDMEVYLQQLATIASSSQR